mgnify:CR=1 FL=1
MLSIYLLLYRVSICYYTKTCSILFDISILLLFKIILYCIWDGCHLYAKEYLFFYYLNYIIYRYFAVYLFFYYTKHYNILFIICQDLLFLLIPILFERVEAHLPSQPSQEVIDLFRDYYISLFIILFILYYLYYLYYLLLFI